MLGDKSSSALGEGKKKKYGNLRITVMATREGRPMSVTVEKEFSLTKVANRCR